MNIVSDITDWKKIRANLSGKTIGFVPTMGNLHAGHLSLCQRAQQENDVAIVSIFINPTQFNQQSDFNHYPRTVENDIKLLRDAQIDYLFLPNEQDIYHDKYQIKIQEDELSQILEGEFRPGHFTGMLTIVLKLLNLTQPTRAYFGEKDYQQLLLIKKMVTALFLPIEIVACETVRAADNLALSSRNSRLNSSQRAQAANFPLLLQRLQPEQCTAALKQLGFKVDYIVEKWQRRLGAVWLDDIRLIDNVKIEG